MCYSEDLPGERRTISALLLQHKNIDMWHVNIYRKQIYDSTSSCVAASESLTETAARDVIRQAFLTHIVRTYLIPISKPHYLSGG